MTDVASTSSCCGCDDVDEDDNEEEFSWDDSMVNVGNYNMFCG